MKIREKKEEKADHKVDDLEHRENDLMEDLKLLETFDLEEYRTDSSASDDERSRLPALLAPIDIEEEMQLDELGRHLEGLADDISVGSEDLDDMVTKVDVVTAQNDLVAGQDDSVPLPPPPAEDE